MKTLKYVHIRIENVNILTHIMISIEQNTLLKQVPHKVWLQHKIDVGSVKSEQPIQIKFKAGIVPPHLRQYLLKQHAIDGNQTNH